MNEQQNPVQYTLAYIIVLELTKIISITSYEFANLIPQYKLQQATLHKTSNINLQ
jgi:hypothetical protein